MISLDKVKYYTHLLYKNIASQEHGEGDTDDKEDITPALLRCRPHELLIIDTEEKTDREDREEAAIEDLGHKDDKDSVNYEQYKSLNI